MKKNIIIAILCTIIVSLICVFSIVLFFSKKSEQEQITAKEPVVQSTSELPVATSGDPAIGDVIPNESDKYVDSFIPTADIDLTTLTMFDLNSPWYSIPDDLNFSENVYATVGGILLDYYDNNVPETFSFDIGKDVYVQLTTMVFGVVVHGESCDLDIIVDMYNNKAQVNVLEKGATPSAAYAIAVSDYE